MPQPWEKYRVGKPSTKPGTFEPTCVDLESVSHVAHILTAKRVIEDYSLHAELVYDESKLNTQ